MKLKKIASLMLAGIMAVSMLAGCKSGDKESANPETPEVTPVTGAAAVVNEELDKYKDKLEFVNDDKLGSLLSQYCTANFTKPSQLNGYQSNMTASNSVNPTITGWAQTLYGADASSFTNVTKNTNTSKKTDLNVFVMSGDLLTEENALRLIGQYIDTLNLPEDSRDGDKSYSYSGTVAAVNAETKGKTENVWVIGVTITQTPADK